MWYVYIAGHVYYYCMLISLSNIATEQIINLILSSSFTLTFLLHAEQQQ